MRRLATLLGWGIGAGAAVAALGAALWLYAAHQPSVTVTVDEVIAPDEAAMVARLVQQATDSLTARAESDHLYKRDAHAKPHGCVRAVCTVRADLPPEYRFGVWAEPGRRYRAWVRFSNGTQDDDTQPDARGMAIKLMGVPGTKLLDPASDPEQDTQDFVMVNYHTFFLRDLAEYERFFDYQLRNQPVRYFFAGWPWQWQLHTLYHGAHMLFQRVPSPLATPYYSMSAYRLGPHNVKFSAQPCEPPHRAMPSPRSPHYLRDALVEDLQAHDACFSVRVQIQDPTRNMPIEDPTIEWDERDAPYVEVARLAIPAQEFSTDAQNRFCEQLQFAPWHALPEHRPVGALNRARLAVYRAVSDRRHTRNGVRRAGPRGWCLDLSGAACPAEEAP